MSNKRSTNRAWRAVGVVLAALSLATVVIHVLFWRLILFGWFAAVDPIALWVMLAGVPLSLLALGFATLEPKQPAVSLVGGLSILANIVSWIGLLFVLVFGISVGAAR